MESRTIDNNNKINKNKKLLIAEKEFALLIMFIIHMIRKLLLPRGVDDVTQLMYRQFIINHRKVFEFNIPHKCFRNVSRHYKFTNVNKSMSIF